MWLTPVMEGLDEESPDAILRLPGIPVANLPLESVYKCRRLGDGMVVKSCPNGVWCHFLAYRSALLFTFTGPFNIYLE